MGERTKAKSEQYRARKAAGQCVSAGSCVEPIHRASRCLKHWEAMRRWAKKSRLARYEQKKVDGICIDTGCHTPALPFTVRCQEHRDRANAARAALAKTPRGRKQLSRGYRRRRVKRKRLGLCLFCPKPSVTELYCQRHREIVLARGHAAHPRKGRSRCSVCRQSNHNRRNCPRREAIAVQGLDVDEFASARMEAA